MRSVLAITSDVEHVMLDGQEVDCLMQAATHRRPRRPG
jgi:hypothetical protein